MDVLMPSGQRVTVEGNRHGYVGAWGCMAWVRGPREHRRVHTAVAGSTRAALTDDGVLDSARVRSVSYAGGTLEAIEHRDETRTTVLWSGRLWELSTYVQARAVDLAQQADFLSTLELADDPAGLVLRPKGGLQVTVDRVLAVNNVPRVCALAIEPGAEAAGKVPGWRGISVRGGELWRDAFPGNGSTLPMGLLANDSSVTSLFASTVAGAGARMAALASSLRVTVEAA